MRHRLPSRRTALLLIAGLTVPPPTWAAPQEEQEGRAAGKAARSYIVRLKDAPAASYTGGTAGLKATRPARGTKLDPTNHDVRAYVSHLDSKHDTVLAGAGGGRKLYGYRYALNGFAAELSPSQAAKLAASGEVLSVEPDEAWQDATATTPDFLGISDPGGLWEQVGGVGRAV